MVTKQLFTVAWSGNGSGSMRKPLTIGTGSAKFSTLGEAIAFAEFELMDDPEITAADDFEKALSDAGMLPLSEKDILDMGDMLGVYESIPDEDGEEEGIALKWQSNIYIIRDYGAYFYDSIIKM